MVVFVCVNHATIINKAYAKVNLNWTLLQRYFLFNYNFFVVIVTTTTF
jgi:hypothetical protein